MVSKFSRHLERWTILTILFIDVIGCSDPVTPEFQYKEGLVFIEALASTAPKASYATVVKSAIEFGVYKNINIENANISFINSKTGLEVPLTFDGEQYVPPDDFSVNVGESWELKTVMPDGTRYLSRPETAIGSVEIQKLNSTYNPELYYDAELGKRIPGHSVTVSFNDPPDQENYYYWRFKTFEKLVYCQICFNGYFRNGECQLFPPVDASVGLKPYYTYGCESDCWQIRYGNNIKIFADEFSNGTIINNIPIAEIPLFTKQNILVELQQFSLSGQAYRYYKTLKDIIDNNSGFNSPLPAVLVGNLFNPEDSDEFVLGRFTVATTTTKQLFIDRTNISEFPLEEIIMGISEGFGEPTPSPQATTAPCVESKYRTGFRPNGWID